MKFVNYIFILISASVFAQHKNGISIVQASAEFTKDANLNIKSLMMQILSIMISEKMQIFLRIIMWFFCLQLFFSIMEKRLRDGKLISL